MCVKCGTAKFGDLSSVSLLGMSEGCSGSTQLIREWNDFNVKPKDLLVHLKTEGMGGSHTSILQ